jgi:hypothetical protein
MVADDEKYSFLSATQMRYNLAKLLVHFYPITRSFCHFFPSQDQPNVCSFATD